jgi:putative NAD(P)H quinone oxidoreductase, PIG3 family
MKAVTIPHPGMSDALTLAERPVPECGDRDVLIRVMAAGVNRPDVAQRKGHYPAPKGAVPDIPGLEVAGEIVLVGKGVTSLKPGDKVCALVTGGGYAEYCVAPEQQCLPIPQGLSFVEAASLPETFFTVWSNVFDRGRFREGESFLVHGGTSGIGVTAIQMVKAMGGTVYATAGTLEKCRFCESLGAVRGINYKEESFRDVVLQLTNNRGVDVILDMIGGPYTQPNLEILAEDGRLVLINFMKGDEATIKLSQVMRKRLTITGSTLRARDVSFKASIAEQLKTRVWPLLESGKIKPVISETFPLSKASAAHDLMESSKHIGKIVLTT